MSAKKKYFTINFIHLITKYVTFYLPLPISVTVSIFTVNAFVFLTLTPNIPIFTAIPQHTMNSLVHCIRHTAYLKTLHHHFWRNEPLCCYDPNWLNNTFYFLVNKLTWTHEDSQFSPQIVLVVLQILNRCVLDFLLYLWSDHLSSWLSYGFYSVDWPRFYFWIL